MRWKLSGERKTRSVQQYIINYYILTSSTFWLSFFWLILAELSCHTENISEIRPRKDSLTRFVVSIFPESNPFPKTCGVSIDSAV